MTTISEATVEDAALAYLESLGWTIAHGPDIAPGAADAERTDYGQVILEQRLRDALARLNPSLPTDALDDAFRKLTLPVGATLEARNRTLHRMLVDGVTVEYRASDGSIRGMQAQVVNFDDVGANDWLAVNQFTVSENQHNRRPDIVLFVNGLPLASDRTQESSGRRRHHLDGLATIPDLQGRVANAVCVQRAADGVGRNAGSRRHAHCRAGVVQALAHHHRRNASRS